MKLRRITPIQQETFYVLSDDNEDLSLIAHSPLCFSPVCYQSHETTAIMFSLTGFYASVS